MVAEAEMDEIFRHAAALAEQTTGRSSPVASKILESSVSQSTCKLSAPIDLDVLKVCAIPEKTKQQTNWCVSRWREWAEN